MKKYLAALSATALICVAPYALAASSTDLTVTGTITPTACTPSLSNAGIIEHGKISAKDLQSDNPTVVGEHNMQLTVACDAPTLFALKSSDNREESAPAGDYNYGIGLTNANEKLGYLQLPINTALADAQPAQAIGSTDGGATWARARILTKSQLLSVGTVADPSAPISVKDLMIDFDVQTVIHRADGLTLTDEVTIDGSATIEVKYL